MEDDEAGWNNLVHTPLLKAVFYGNTPRGRQLDGFRPWYIIPSYYRDKANCPQYQRQHPPRIPNKRVVGGKGRLRVSFRP
jgi:hypothetical protein